MLVFMLENVSIRKKGRK